MALSVVTEVATNLNIFRCYFPKWVHIHFDGVDYDTGCSKFVCEWETIFFQLISTFPIPKPKSL